MASKIKKFMITVIVVAALLLCTIYILKIYTPAKDAPASTTSTAEKTQKSVTDKKDSTSTSKETQKSVTEKNDSTPAKEINTTASSKSQTDATQSPPAQSNLIDVPLMNQMSAPRLYNGCEVTSLAMVLNYNGYNVTKNELAEKIATVPFNYGNGLKGNPNQGFVGDMEDGPGLGVYNGPIYNLARQYAGDKVVNLTNHPFTDLLKYVSEGQPVWIITTTKFAPVSVFEKWPTPQGTIEITFSEHSVVITGYDENYIYINDPYGYNNRKLERSNFEKAWEQMGKQAIVIEK